MKSIDECLAINIDALVAAGFINSKDDMSMEELEELKKVIEHAKGLE